MVQNFIFSLDTICLYHIINDFVNTIIGAKYELPKYVLSEPTNLIRES